MNVVEIVGSLTSLDRAAEEFRAIEHAITYQGRVEVADTLARKWGVSREALLRRVEEER